MIKNSLNVDGGALVLVDVEAVGAAVRGAGVDGAKAAEAAVCVDACVGVGLAVAADLGWSADFTIGLSAALASMTLITCCSAWVELSAAFCARVLASSCANRSFVMLSLT